VREEINLHLLYTNEAVKDFGNCLKKAIFEEEDFASLIELEHAETEEEFAEAIKKILRRNYKGWRPKQTSLEEIMKLLENYKVKLVKAAIISHALTY
jgi:hypothetical protein